MAFIPQKHGRLAAQDGGLTSAVEILGDPIARRWAEAWDAADPSCRWDVDAVDLRLIDAIRLAGASAGAIGPNAMKGFWPQLEAEWGDLLAQAGGGKELDFEPRVGPSARDMTRMEEAIRWPVLYLQPHDGPRRVLMLWLRCKAYRIPFRKAVQKIGWTEGTAKRRRWHAALIIATGLMKDRVEVTQ